MVTFGEAQAYVGKHAASPDDAQTLHSFFACFEMGGYDIIDADKRVGSAAFFRHTKQKLSHVFVYRILSLKTNELSYAFSCFDGQERRLADYVMLFSHAQAYLGKQADEDDEQELNLKPFGRRKLPIDGALLIGGQETDSVSKLKCWHATRAYLSNGVSRKILYGSLELSLTIGFG